MKQSDIEKLDRKSGLVLIVKPTNMCNLDCKYCYDKPIRQQMPNTKMSPETFEHAIKLVNQYTSKSTILWHGGEPLLMGQEFYYECNEVLHKYYTTEFTQQMQTNGLCIYNDRSWIDVFKDLGIHPGTSYDGIYQYMRQGNSKDYMRELLDIMQENNIGGGGGITVVHNQNIGELIPYYEFLKSEFKGDYRLTLNLAFSTRETFDPDFVLEPETVFGKMYEFYSYMLRDATKLAIYDYGYERSVNALLRFSGVRRGCEIIDCRKRWLTVLADGTLIPCSRFSIYHTFGNINDYSSVEDIFDSEGFRDYIRITQNRLDTMCKDCELIESCNGGCFAKFLRNDSSQEQAQCDIIKSWYMATYKSLLDIDLDTTLSKHFITNTIQSANVVPPKLVKLAVNTLMNEEWYSDITATNSKEVFSSLEYTIDVAVNNVGMSLVCDNCTTLQEIWEINREYILGYLQECRGLLDDLRRDYSESRRTTQ